MRKRTAKWMAFLLCFAIMFSILPAQVHAATDTLTIFHTNDVHGQAVGDPATNEKGEPTENGKIGYARYKTIIDQAKAAGDVLVVDLGDNTHGTNFASLSSGINMVTMMNMVGVEAFVPGNHDFNYGYQHLAQTIKEEAKFPILAANVVYESTGKPVFESNAIINKGNYQIGLFGLATPETKTKSSPLNTQGVIFKDVVETAKEQVAELKASGADVIILMSHLGMDEASDITTYTVLDAVTGIDLALDGHSHTLLPEGKLYKNTWIGSAGGYMENIGKVSVTITDEKVTAVKPGLLTFKEVSGVAADKPVTDKINELNAENDEVLLQKIGKTNSELDGLREHVRTGETNLGNLITDAMLAESGADVVLTNGGGIRASIPQGDINIGHVLAVLPFGNALTVIEVTGQDIIDAVTFGVDDWPNAAGKMPHVAGMKVIITPTETANEVQVLVDDKPINPNGKYKLATNDFMAIGGDGYEMFKGKEQVTLHGLLADIVIQYVTDESGDDGLTIAKDDRMTVAPFKTDRVSGENRYATAAAISKANFTKADVVVMANGSDKTLPDALTAAPLAAQNDAPVLLIDTNSIPEAVGAELARLKPSKVYIIGGENSISQKAVSALDKGIEVLRLSGATRYETANAVSNAMFSAGAEKTKLYLASGQNLVDALSISNLAVRDIAPVLLTQANQVPAQTKTILDQAKEVVIAGGVNSVSKAVEDALVAKATRLSGADRYLTSVAIASEVKDSKKVAIASGQVSVDALAVAPILGVTDQILLLTQKDALPAGVKTLLQSLEPTEITVYGGLNTIGLRTEAALSGLVVPAAE